MGAPTLNIGQCALCSALIQPTRTTDPDPDKAIHFGAIDPLCDAAIEHVAQEHPDEMRNVLMAATLLTVYLASAFLVTNWPAWEETRQEMAAGLKLIFTSADAQPADAEDVAKGCAGAAGANG